MAGSYPYIISNNKVEPILKRVRSAAKPERLTVALLSDWGFTASNDRAILRILKDLGFLTEDGSPTPFYDRLRDQTDWKFVLAERMRDLYSQIFAVDAEIQAAPEQEIKGAISRVTGRDDETVKRIFATFKTLAGLADFSPRSGKGAPPPPPPPKEEEETGEKLSRPKEHGGGEDRLPHRVKSEFHYNIQIHLPATTDITVYNAIFRSLREHIGVQ